MVDDARKSCDATALHIEQSRGAIQRSLRLLGVRFGRVDED